MTKYLSWSEEDLAEMEDIMLRTEPYSLDMKDLPLRHPVTSETLIVDWDQFPWELILDNSSGCLSKPQFWCQEKDLEWGEDFIFKFINSRWTVFRFKDQEIYTEFVLTWA